MEKKGVAFVAALVGLIVIAGGLSYVYLSSGQSGYVNGSDDGTDDGADNGTPDGNDDPNEGLDLAHGFTLPKVGGGSISLDNYKGKVVVLDFMATWCGPCVTELAHLKDIDQGYGDDVVILSIDVDAQEDDPVLLPFIAQHSITWPVLRDTAGISQASGYSASSIPTLVIINKDGYIQQRFVGVTQASALESVIDSIL
jgi:thiol-disulfide isomerase/thioredoxin